MLATAQLLAGSGVSVYACIRNDGSFCCLDLGPETCTCCADEASGGSDQAKKVTEEPTGCECCRSSEASPNCDEHSIPQSELNTSVGLEAPCGCTHILLSHDQTAIRAVRTTTAGDLSQSVPAFAVLPQFAQHDSGDHAGRSLSRRFTPPGRRSHALTVLSLVLIQC